MAEQATSAQQDRVRNVRVLTRNDPSPEIEKSMSRTFEREKSMQAEAVRAQNKEAANEASYQTAMADQEAANEALYQRSAEVVRNMHLQRLTVLKAQGQATHAARGLKKLRPFSWAGLGAAFTAYIWQLVFALLAIAGFFLKGTQVSLADEGLLGKIASFFLSFPAEAGEAIGFFCWGIGVLLSFGVFFGFLIWFTLQGINTLKTHMSFLVTASCLALNILPFTNIFPWLVLWVIYINVSALKAK